MKNKKNETLVEKVKMNRIFRFIFSLKFIIILLILILITAYVLFKIKINHLEKEHIVKENKIINNYELKIDSLYTANIELTVKAFSWAIRSELTRENIEQVNQLMIAFVHEPNIQNVKLVNQENSKIEISTNKKEEGREFENKELLMIDNTTTIRDTNLIRVANPIMGLNKKLGMLIVEIKLGYKNDSSAVK